MDLETVTAKYNDVCDTSFNKTRQTPGDRYECLTALAQLRTRAHNDCDPAVYKKIDNQIFRFVKHRLRYPSAREDLDRIQEEYFPTNARLIEKMLSFGVDDFEHDTLLLEKAIRECQGSPEGFRNFATNLLGHILAWESHHTDGGTKKVPRIKKLRKLKGRVKKSFSIIRYGCNYGMPPRMHWNFDLASSDEGRPIMEEITQKKEAFRYLWDKNHDSHPEWFVFLIGSNNSLRKTVPIMAKPEGHDPGAPKVTMQSMDASFADFPNFREQFYRDLIAFFRGEEFREKTGYQALFLTGFKSPLYDLADELQLVVQQGLHVPTRWGKSKVYSCHLENPGQSVRFVTEGNGSKPFSLSSSKGVEDILRNLKRK